MTPLIQLPQQVLLTTNMRHHRALQRLQSLPSQKSPNLHRGELEREAQSLAASRALILVTTTMSSRLLRDLRLVNHQWTACPAPGNRSAIR